MLKMASPPSSRSCSDEEDVAGFADAISGAEVQEMSAAKFWEDDVVLDNQLSRAAGRTRAPPNTTAGVSKRTSDVISDAQALLRGEPVAIRRDPHASPKVGRGTPGSETCEGVPDSQH